MGSTVVLADESGYYWFTAHVALQRLDITAHCPANERRG